MATRSSTRENRKVNTGLDLLSKLPIIQLFLYIITRKPNKASLAAKSKARISKKTAFCISKKISVMQKVIQTIKKASIFSIEILENSDRNIVNIDINKLLVILCF